MVCYFDFTFDNSPALFKQQYSIGAVSLTSNAYSSTFLGTDSVRSNDGVVAPRASSSMSNNYEPTPVVGTLFFFFFFFWYHCCCFLTIFFLKNSQHHQTTLHQQSLLCRHRCSTMTVLAPPINCYK
jgi:hypothetical protein